MQKKLLGIISMDFNATDQLLTDQIFCIHHILEKKWSKPMKLVRLIEKCFNEIYSKVCIDNKHLSDAFPIQNGLK